ncbi:MAG: hypothetical protein WCO30_01640 [bacterium]
MIKLTTNKELDYEMYQEVSGMSFGGINFGNKITANHPFITKENHKQYIDDYYVKHEPEIKDFILETQTNIDKTQFDFFNAVENIFGEDYSKDFYTGFVSIFDCNPRWPETKSFQINLTRTGLRGLEIIYHESLHFVFFDYCDKYLTDETSEYSKNDGILWELSEIFDTIILNLPDFRTILVNEEEVSYPALSEKTEHIKQIWNKYPNDVKTVILESLKYLNKNK